MNELQQLHQKLDHLLQVVEQQQTQISSLHQALKDTSSQCPFCGKWKAREYYPTGHRITCPSCNGAYCHFDRQDELLGWGSTLTIKNRSYQVFINYRDNRTVVECPTTTFIPEVIIDLDHAVKDWTPTNVQAKVEALLPYL